MLNRDCELPLDLIYEFQNLIKVMSERKDLEKDIVQVMDLIGPNMDELEVGYNNLKKVFTTAIAKKKSATPKAVAPVALPISFIDQFDKKAIMSKVNIARLCVTSVAWVHNHKQAFEQTPKGINVRSFLKWLQTYNPTYYNNFRENFAG